jgi:hypothetical protein
MYAGQLAIQNPSPRSYSSRPHVSRPAITVQFHGLWKAQHGMHIGTCNMSAKPKNVSQSGMPSLALLLVAVLVGAIGREAWDRRHFGFLPWHLFHQPCVDIYSGDLKELQNFMKHRFVTMKNIPYAEVLLYRMSSDDGHPSPVVHQLLAIRP